MQLEKKPILEQRALDATRVSRRSARAAGVRVAHRNSFNDSSRLTCNIKRFYGTGLISHCANALNGCWAHALRHDLTAMLFCVFIHPRGHERGAFRCAAPASSRCRDGSPCASEDLYGFFSAATLRRVLSFLFESRSCEPVAGECRPDSSVRQACRSQAGWYRACLVARHARIESALVEPCTTRNPRLRPTSRIRRSEAWCSKHPPYGFCCKPRFHVRLRYAQRMAVARERRKYFRCAAFRSYPSSPAVFSTVLRIGSDKFF